MSTNDDHRIITLTGQPPVRIQPEDWPLIARAEDWTGTHRRDAAKRWRLEVLQHDDGRAIVAGEYVTLWEGDRDYEGGELVPAGGDIVAAIRRIAEEIGGDARLVQRCIADLPAVDL